MQAFFINKTSKKKGFLTWREHRLEDGHSVGFCFQDGEREERFASRRSLKVLMFHVQNQCYCNTWVCLSGSRTSCRTSLLGAGTWEVSSSQQGPASPQQPRMEAEPDDLHFSHPTLPLRKQHFIRRSLSGGKKGGKILPCSLSRPQLGMRGGPWGLSGLLGRQPLLHGPFGLCPCRDFQGPIRKSIFLPLVLSHSTCHLLSPPPQKAANRDPEASA